MALSKFIATCRRHPHWMALFSFTLIVSLTHWPLVLNMPTHVFGRPFEDSFGILWDLEWAWRALFVEQVSPFYNPDVFYPAGFHVSASSPPMWWFVFFSPLTALAGPVITYNLLMLGIMVLTALGVYLLVTYLGGHWFGGILAGSIFIAAPIYSIRLAGHIDIMLSCLWLPYLALFAHKTVQNTRPHNWLLTGLFWGLTCLGHWQFVFLTPLIPLVILGLSPADLTFRHRLSLFVRVALVALLVILPFLVITVYSRGQMYAGTPAFSIASADSFSLSPDRLLVPNPLHSIWGAWSRTTFPLASEASVVSIGYMALLLAIPGVFSHWPQRRTYITLIALALIGALGITLHLNEQPVLLNLSDGVAETIRPVVEHIVGPELMPPGTTTVIPLPLAILYRLVPLFGLTRVWARFMLVGMLAIGVLAGFGFTFLARRFPQWIIPVGGLILVIVLLEGLITPYDNFTAVRDNHRPVDEWLANQPPVALIEYPLPFADKLAMYRQSLHQQRIVNGYASITPSQYANALPTLGNWPNPAGVALLREWDVDYILVNGSLNDAFQNDILPPIQAIKGLCLLRTDTEPEHNRQTLVFQILREDQPCP